MTVETLQHGRDAHPLGTTCPPQILEEAIGWMVRLQSRGDAATRQACEQWRAADVVHEQAWVQLNSLENAWQGFSTLPSGAASTAIETALARKQRRRTLKLLGLAGMGAGATLVLGRHTSSWQNWQADYVAATGQRRQAWLQDGTQLLLNTNTAVEIDFRPDERRIVLLRGEIYLDTGSDPGHAHRPLCVITGVGRFTALGTRFLVRQEADFVLLQVDEGRVAIEGSTLVAEAGQSYRVSGVQAWLQSQADMRLAAWVDGVLDVRDMRLTDFAAELSRYRQGWLGCDEEIADLRISGVFRLDDMAEVFRALQRSLPVQVETRWRYWAHLRKRQA